MLVCLFHIWTPALKSSFEFNMDPNLSLMYNFAQGKELPSKFMVI